MQKLPQRFPENIVIPEGPKRPNNSCDAWLETLNWLLCLEQGLKRSCSRHVMVSNAKLAVTLQTEKEEDRTEKQQEDNTQQQMNKVQKGPK